MAKIMKSDFEWDGALLLERFDMENTNDKNEGCKVGSSFLVKIGEV